MGAKLQPFKSVPVKVFGKFVVKLRNEVSSLLSKFRVCLP